MISKLLGFDKIFNSIKSINSTITKFYPLDFWDKLSLPIIIIGLTTATYLKLVSKDNDTKINYENKNRLIVIDPNIKPDITLPENIKTFNKNNESGWIKDSDFVPISKYLSPEKLQFLKNYVTYNILNKIQNDKDSKNLIYDFKNLNITNIKDLKKGNKYSINVDKIDYLLVKTDYYFKKEIGDENVFIKIDSTDTKNIISRYITNVNSLSFICNNFEYKDKTVIFSDCETSYEYINKYFYQIYYNLNNNPSFLNNSAKNYFYYMIISTYKLEKNSICYSRFQYDDIYNYVEKCNQDLEISRKQINTMNNLDKNKYLEYTNIISKSLKIDIASLSYNSGFEVLDYKFAALKIISAKYNLNENWEYKYVNDDINKIYDPKNPEKVLDLSLYDDYKYKHLDEIEQAKINKMKKN